MEQKIFNLQGDQMFRQDIKRAGIDYSRAMGQLSSGSLIDNGIIRDNTKWSDEEINAARFQFERDELAILVSNMLQEMLIRWSEIPNGYAPAVNGNLPCFTVKELSRTTGLSPEKLRDLLEKYPPTFRLNGERMVAQLEEWPDGQPPSDNTTITEARSYNVSPKKIITQSRFQSRPPGGGPVQKSAIKKDKVGRMLRQAAQSQRKIRFVSSQKNAPDEFGVMPELQLDNKSTLTNLSPEQIIYQEPNGDQIMEVFKWLKTIGFCKNWVLEGKESLFAEQLVRFSRGEEVDFNIWNCIGFKWFDENGEFPTCEINNNVDAAISLYFLERIMEITQALSTIGNPNIFILIPSNEAFDDRVWRYRQAQEVRERVINDAVNQLQKGFDATFLPANANLSIMWWDDYLKYRGLTLSPQEYSFRGEKELRSSPKFAKIIREAIRSGGSYFEGQNINTLSSAILADRQPKYYGVYAGEGVAFSEMQERGQNVVIINFEEMRVPQMAYRGARGNLAVLTPITPYEMNKFYHWESEQIQKRNL